jgi:uncharacterized damage-inducible protein DinB
VHIEDRLEILENLKAGREAFLEALSDVTEELARRSPGPGKWSVFECVEHVATAEEYLLAQITSAKLAEIPMINIAREALIMKRGMDRRRRFDAPEDAKPRNRFATLKEALAHFESTREKTIQFVENCLDDPRTMMARHPIIGLANNYEMLLMMIVHPHRHADQIREIIEAVTTSFGD